MNMSCQDGYDRAKPQVRSEGSREASFRDLESKRAIGTGIRPTASHHQEAEQYACRRIGITARDRNLRRV